MKINLFDVNFAHDICSVAGKTPKHIEYVRNKMEWDGITLFTDSYLLDEDLIRSVKSPIKIGWLHEPECLWPNNYKLDRYQLSLFNFVMTYHQPLLEQDNKKYLFSPYGGAWLEPEHWGLRPKTKLVSMLYGNKFSTNGHRIRHEIADKLGDRYPIDFYGFRGTPVAYGPATKLQVLGDYKYSIVVETCYQENLFTEILLDCFAVGTIPIFWGCPNIGEFFEWGGLLPFSGLADLEVNLDFVARYGDEYYNEMKDTLARNLDLVADYAITEDWQYKNIYKGLV